MTPTTCDNKGKHCSGTTGFKFPPCTPYIRLFLMRKKHQRQRTKLRHQSTHTHIHTLIQCLYTAYTNTYWAYIQKSQRVPQLTLFTAPLLHRRVRGKISCPLFFFPSLWVPHSSIRCKDKRIWRQTLYPPLVSPHMQYTSSFSVSICWFGSDPSACQWTSLWYGDTRRQTAFT